jgi:hypothetical protein
MEKEIKIGKHHSPPEFISGYKKILKQVQYDEKTS